MEYQYIDYEAMRKDILALYYQMYLKFSIQFIARAIQSKILHKYNYKLFISGIIDLIDCQVVY